MYELIKNLNKFEDILLINKNESTKTTKDKIIKFLEKYNEQDSIEDFFFYFTGHGQCDEDEFYYLLSDFSFSELKQTSLENSELDNWIRNLNPKTTIKVVDACYSGMPYIKGLNLVKYPTCKQFNNCYFMYSSQSNQTSAQSDISFFTASFLKCILNSKNGNLRYKEIIDYISDDFKKNKYQIPYFVCQGKYTEVFGNITTELKSNLSNQFNLILKNPQDSKELDSTSENKPILLDLIKRDAKKYCSEDEMMDNLLNIKKLFEEYTINNAEIKDIFEYEYKILSDYPDDIDLAPIGNWINDNNNNFFSQPTYKKESYKETIKVKKTDPYSILSSLGRNLYEDKEVTKYRNVITGFELTQDVPYNCVKISYIPKYENLKYYSTFILFTFSKTDIVFFTYTSDYKELNWQKRIFNNDNNWKPSTMSAKGFNNIQTFINKVFKSIEDMITTELKTKFGLSTLDN